MARAARRRCATARSAAAQHGHDDDRLRRQVEREAAVAEVRLERRRRDGIRGANVLCPSMDGADRMRPGRLSCSRSMPPKSWTA
jgi:hypothetical protein